MTELVTYALKRRCDAYQQVIARAWYGMEWKMKWNGTEISVWNVEDTKMEWNGRFQEWNGRQSSILSYQFHTRFRALYLQKNTHRCRVVIKILSQKYSTSISTHFQYLSTNRSTLVVYIAQTVYVLHHCK